jgi:hypothetical protein
MPDDTGLGFGILVIGVCLLFEIWYLVLSALGSRAIFEMM